MNDLSIVAYAPVIRQNIDSYHERIEHTTLDYTITAGVGFDTAAFAIRAPLAYLADWWSDGLARDVIVTAGDGGTAWHGYVNRLLLSVGSMTRSKSLDGMVNRLHYTYRAIDTTKTPPLTGAQTTLTKNDTASQAKYGVKAGVLSGDECTAATADDQALATLAALAEPRVSETHSLGQGKPPELHVELRGYAYMADWYLYDQTAVTGTADGDALIILALAADPNGVLSTDARNIDNCTTQVAQYRETVQAWKLITEITSRGREVAGIGYQWTCGVYEGRRATYKAAEATDAAGVAIATNKHLTLTRHVAEKGDVITDEAGRHIMPWELRPDRLLYTAGLPGRPMYITAVRYTDPGRVVLNGTDVLNPMAGLVTGAGCGK